MSTEEKAKEAISMIESLMADSREIVASASQDRDFNAANERLSRWKSRAVRLLSEKVNSIEGKRLKDKHLGSWSYVNELDNIQDEANLYYASLQSLMEDLNEHPEDYFSMPIPSEEKSTIPKVPESTSPKKVFVVHGRNDKLRGSMFDFLRALGLNPVEWSQAIRATQKASPYIGEILDVAFDQAQAVIVMFSGDYYARLREEFLRQNDQPWEKEFTPQPRPNVIFEAGMAMGRNVDRTLLVQVGELRLISDIAGRHITRLDNSPEKRQELVTKLQGAGCEVNTSGTDWLSTGDFA